MDIEKDFDFQAGETLLIDKPLTWTSFDVVNKLRYELKKLTGIKRFKVGHAGTLDPLATGLLIICTGKATKTIDQIQAQEKEYTGIIKLGATTPSYDLETEIDHTFPTDHITLELMQQAAQELTGSIEQTPPIFSAKKVDGKRAYLAARKGTEIKLKPSLVTVNSFELEKTTLPDIHFRVACSKGTYIRSLAHDFGKLLSSGSHLTALRREKIGHFDVAEALTIDQAVDLIQSKA